MLHLGRLNSLDRGDNTATIAHLCQGIFHLLALGGIAPQLYDCCVTKQSIAPNFNVLNWQVGFSISSGSIVSLDSIVADPTMPIDYRLSALDLVLFQHLSDPHLDRLNREIQSFPIEIISDVALASTWRRIEKILRNYIYHHLNLQIRSAALIDC